MWLAAAVLLTSLSAFWPGPRWPANPTAAAGGASGRGAPGRDAWLASTEAQFQPTQAQQPAFAAYAEAIRAQAELKAEHRTAGLFVTAPCCRPHRTPPSTGG